MWNNKILTLVTESLLFVAGILVYLKSTKAANKKGSYLFWSFIAIITIFYIMSVFGPAPTSTSAIKYTAMGQWLFIALGCWIDKYRTVA